jgi:hypothetical protein
MRWKLIALVVVVAGALPAAAFGAGHVPSWMERMMGQSSPEMQQLMDNSPPGMEQMMKSPGMEQAMKNAPQGMDQMMQTPGMMGSGR